MLGITEAYIIDKIVDEQINRSRLVAEQNVKTRTIVDIYNLLHSKITVDENVLLKEVLMVLRKIPFSSETKRIVRERQNWNVPYVIKGTI